MRLHDRPDLARRLISDARESWDRRHTRPDGLHVSDLIFCARKAWFRRARRRAGQTEPPPRPEDDMLLLLGHGVHAILEGGGQEYRVQGTLAGHAVTGTVDLLVDGRPVEIKTTRASANRPPAEHYLEQLAAYCHLLGMQDGFLAVWHLLGTRQGPSTPVLRVHHATFTARDLDAWAQELAGRVGLVTGSALPPLGEHHTWECHYCPFGPRGTAHCPGGKGTRDGGFFAPDEPPAWVTTATATR